MKNKIFLRPGTRAFIREARHTKGYTLFDFIHGYIYGRWPYLYIGIGAGEHRLARFARRLGPWADRLIIRKRSTEKSPPNFADTYHGKVVPLEQAAQLVTINEPVHLTAPEQVIPYSRARDIILQNPDHIVVIDCPCRSSRLNPCQPLDVCLIIGEPFAGFVHEHHPQRSRWITQEEAVSILEAEHERGHVHHAFFKDAMLNRFYAICNCCACCCGAMQAQRNGVPMLASSGYLSEVDEDLCLGCGECQESCQFSALTVQDNLACVDQQACMGCGVCITKCPQGALSLVRAPEKGDPLEISVLAAH